MPDINFWKVLGFVGFMSNWAASSLIPDPDGVVRIDQQEMEKFFAGMCAQFGWKAEIVVPIPTTKVQE